MLRAMARRSFDEAYYRRFYESASTRVASERDFRRLGRFVTSYVTHMNQPVRNVLDLGCGIGAWQRIVKRRFPKATYTGVEISKYLCRKHGWVHSSIDEYRDEQRYDLVICQGVLPYLDGRTAKKAIKNMARLCRGVLYLEAVTREDWDEKVDQTRTDDQIHLRRAAWYRAALERHFECAGGGLYLSEDSPAVLYELELAGRQV